MKARDQLQLLVKTSNDPNLRARFKNDKKTVRGLIENSKFNHFRERFRSCRGNTKKMWKTAEHVLPHTKSDFLAHLTTEEIRAKAEDFNEYFASVGEKAFLKSRENISEEIYDSNLSLNANFDNYFSFQPVDVDSHSHCEAYK